MLPKTSRALAAVVCILILAAPAAAGDWPQWRCSPGRGAYTPDALPKQLHLQWVRQLPKPKSCWPWNQYKQQFDVSYEPVVKGKLLFVPSMVRDSVTAYDTDTGREKWRFYTDAPVRFAPVAWNDKVIFGSDDGYLYCLDAGDGRLEWKLRGAPLRNRVLANGRLSSMYPVRGAPVVYGDKVYFAAGCWPFLGTFIHEVDLATGKPTWSNSGSHAIYILQPHSSPAFAGVAPQGYLVATNDRLIVPGGRAVPAGYDRATGRFLWHDANTKRGGYEVWAAGRVYWNDNLLGHAATGRMSFGNGAKIVTNDAIVGMERGQIVARSLDAVAKVVVRSRAPRKVSLPELWRANSGGVIDRVHIVAGDRAYGSKGGVVAAVDKNGGVSWRGQVDGDAWNMLAADNKLFVVTREGRIYCFGAEKVEPQTYAYKPQPPRRRDDGWAKRAAAIIKAGGANEGYCVVLGIGSGRLIGELVRQSKLSVIVLEPDAKKADAARRKCDAAGWYGGRVHVVVGDLSSVKMPPYLADLVTSEDARAAGLDEDDALRRAFDMLRPYGGTLCLTADVRLRRRAAALKLSGAEVAAVGTLATLRRTGALPGTADWSHQYGDMTNSVFSADKTVRAPLGMLWFGGPSNMDVLPRHGHGPTPQAVAGRLIIEGIGVLQARDVYTGRTIWKRKFPKLNTFDMYYNKTYNPNPYDRSYNQVHTPGANWFGSNHVTTADKVYLADQQVCHVLDAATGETITELKFPAKAGLSSANWGFIGVSGELLIATARPLHVPSERAGGGKVDIGSFKPVIAKNAEWQYLAGAHPAGDWTKPGYAAKGWKTGTAGFGYADNDDRTVLGGMKGRYSVVYCRRTFRVKSVKDVPALAIGIRFDDGVIAYLNGKEVLRQHVKRGRGARVRGVSSHEAGQYEHYVISNAAALLRKGENVIAFEGHNRHSGSSDFSLDPYLLVGRKDAAPKQDRKIAEVKGVRANHRFGVFSQVLVVMDRHTGGVMWTRPAKYGWRHNTIIAGAGKVFCIDRMNDAQVLYLKRRGVNFSQKPTLYALDLRTGKVVWQSDENVFGTWLGYSNEHDVLLQGGSRAGDRGYDEVGAGMTVYRGESGKVLWSRKDGYSGPPILHHDKIITQTGGGNRQSPPARVFHLLTGNVMARKHPMTGETIPWNWVRFKGCNTAVASEHLLTFRSAAASFVPLDISQGTASIGGFKSGCTSNLIVANGVLNAPDYTRTCTCAYQNQSSLAMVHMPELEYWSFDFYPPPGQPAAVKRVGINFGAPGNRMADNGTLWTESPSLGGPSPDVPVRVSGGAYFRAHNTTVRGKLNWVAASGVQGMTSIAIRPFLQPEKRSHTVWGWHKRMGSIPRWAEGAIGGRFAKPKPYTVRLHFAEPDGLGPGRRIFSVAVQGKVVLKNFDVAKAAGGPSRSIVKELKGVRITDDLRLTFEASEGRPLICGVELIAE